MSRDYDLLQQNTELHQPELWARCYPRRFHNVGEWHSPKVPATVFASSVSNARVKQVIPMMHPREQNLYALACMLETVKMPTYFVSRPLFEAVLRTKLPDDLDWREMKMPLPAMTFMIPRGSLRREGDGDVAFISIGRGMPGERHRYPEPHCPGARVMEPMLIAASGFPEHPQFPIHDIAMNGTTSPLLGDIAALDRGNHVVTDPKTGTMQFQPMTVDQARFNSNLMILALNLVLVLGARPQLVEEGMLEKRVTRAPGPDGTPLPPHEFWSPNILGRNYRVKSEWQGGTHATPRIHWRVGHTRWQRHGPGLVHEKELWIEPVLVMSQETTST